MSMLAIVFSQKLHSIVPVPLSLPRIRDRISACIVQVSMLAVFFKQRMRGLYPSWAYTAPGSYLRIYYSATEALIWSCIVYWLVGFVPDAGRQACFLRASKILCACNNMQSSAPAAHAALSAASLNVFCAACNDRQSHILMRGTLSETLRLGRLSETQGTMHAMCKILCMQICCESHLH